MGSAVSFKWNRGFWPGVMTSAQMRGALLVAAEAEAAAARGRIGQPHHPHRFRNPNFTAAVVTRHGKDSPYLVGLVRAGNPRSIYKARHDGALGR